MRKIISAVAAASMLTLSPMTVSAHTYEHYVYDSDESSGYIYEIKEYKVGAFIDKESRFYGCDMYKYETNENIPDFPFPISNEQNYLLVPSEKLGGLFSSTGNSALGDKPYEVKLPLSTCFKLDDETLESVNTHNYSIYTLCKKAPYICVKTDSDTESPFNSEKLAEMFPDIQKKYMGRDSDGNYIYRFANSFEKYACDCENLLAESDAKALLKLGNDHMLSFSFCDEYETYRIQLGDSPIYEKNNAEKACEVFEEHGAACKTIDVKNGVQLIFDNELSAVEYYEIMCEIAEKHDIRPYIPVYEKSSAPEVVSVEILDNVLGDANCDGSVNLADAVYVMQSLANPSKYAMSAQGSFNGDIDESGNGITAKDALAIQQRLLGV